MLLLRGRTERPSTSKHFFTYSGLEAAGSDSCEDIGKGVMPEQTAKRLPLSFAALPLLLPRFHSFCENSLVKAHRLLLGDLS